MDIPAIDAKTRRKRTVTARPGSQYCRSCRAKKIKCSGERPQCRTCALKGRPCQYASWKLDVLWERKDHPPVGREQQHLDVGTSINSGSSEASDEVVVEKYHDRSLFDAVLHMQPKSISFSADPLAMYSVDFYQRKIVSSLARQGPYQSIEVETYFHYLADRGRTDPVLFYSIAAMGQVYRSSTLSLHSSLVRDMDRQARRLALQFYGTALSHLKAAVAAAQTQFHALESVLCSAILLFLVELAMDNSAQAASHYRWASRVRDECIGKIMNLSTDTVIGRACAGLAFGHSDRNQARKGPVQHRFSRSLWSVLGGEKPVLCVQPPPAIYFEDELEAEIALERILDDAYDLQTELVEAAHRSLSRATGEWTISAAAKSCLAHTLSKFVDMDRGIRDHLVQTRNAHHHWSVALRTLAARDDVPNTMSTARLLLLHIRSFVLQFNLITCRDATELIADHFAPECARCLQHIEEYLSLGATTSTAQGPPINTKTRTVDRAGIYDMGILSAISTIAIKCRVPSIRHRAAVTMAQCERDEGFYRSASLAIFARMVIDIEEGRGLTEAGQVAQPPAQDVASAPHLLDRAKFADTFFHQSIGSTTASLVGTRVDVHFHGEVIVEEFTATDGSYNDRKLQDDECIFAGLQPSKRMVYDREDRSLRLVGPGSEVMARV